MDKAIEKIKWLQDVFVIRKEQQHFDVDVTIKDAFAEALSELQAHKAKMEELQDKYNKLLSKHDFVCYNNCENLCWEDGEYHCEEEACIRNYNDPSLYIDVYKDKYRPKKELDK